MRAICPNWLFTSVLHPRPWVSVCLHVRKECLQLQLASLWLSITAEANHAVKTGVGSQWNTFFFLAISSTGANPTARTQIVNGSSVVFHKRLSPPNCRRKKKKKRASPAGLSHARARICRYAICFDSRQETIPCLQIAACRSLPRIHVNKLLWGLYIYIHHVKKTTPSQISTVRAGISSFSTLKRVYIRQHF